MPWKPDADVLKVAAETFAITPQLGREGRSLVAAPVERIFSPLNTTVVLIEDEGEQLCLICSHFMTHYYCFSNLMRKRVAEQLGLPMERVLDFSSHNHCGVKLVEQQYGFGRHARDVWMDPAELSPEGAMLIDQAGAVAASLPDRLEAVELRWGLGHERRISHNRKGHRADGTTYMMREADRLELGADFCGDIDDDAAVVGFFGSDDKPRCFLTWFTAHPVTAFDPEHPVVFGEFSQVACDLLSDAFDRVPVGFLQGCAGDVNAKGLLADKPIEQSVADATYFGHCLAQTWLDAISRPTVSQSRSLGFERRIVELPFAPVPPADALDASLADMERFIERCSVDEPDTLTCQGLNFPPKMSPRYRGALVEPLLRWARWARSLHEPNASAKPPHAAEIEVATIRLGDVGIVGMSCEPFDAIGRQIKRDAPTPLTLPCGYMHDTCLGYVPDSGNNGDNEYMSAFYRYTTTLLPYAQPAGDRLAEAGVELLNRLAAVPA